MSALDGWSFRADDVPARGVLQERSATSDELAALAAELGVPGVERLDVRYRLKSDGSRRYRLTGTVRARLTLECGVTLEPLTQEMEEQLDVGFWPADEIGQRPVAFDALDEDDPEPIANGRLAIGAYVTEVVASSIDVFARAPDAVLDVTKAGDEGAAPVGTVSPFAVLSKLKDGGGSS